MFDQIEERLVVRFSPLVKASPFARILASSVYLVDELVLLLYHVHKLLCRMHFFVCLHRTIMEWVSISNQFSLVD